VVLTRSAYDSDFGSRSGYTKDYKSNSMARTNHIRWDYMWCSFCTTARFNFYTASSLNWQSAGRTCCSSQTHYLDSESTNVCSYSLMLLNRETTNTKIIVFSLTRSWLQPMIYRTRVEHANNYTANADTNRLIFLIRLLSQPSHALDAKNYLPF